MKKYRSGDAGYPTKKPSGISVVETARMLNFPADMAYVNSGVHRLDNQSLVRYFDEEWGLMREIEQPSSRTAFFRSNSLHEIR